MSTYMNQKINTNNDVINDNTTNIIRISDVNNNSNKKMNNYVRYFINNNTFMLVFSIILSLITTSLFMFKLYNLDITDDYFTLYFTTLITLITLWSQSSIQSIKEKRKDNDYEKYINQYVIYFINKRTIMLIFSAFLTLSGILLCTIKLYINSNNDPSITLYITTIMSLITLWIPIQFIKTKQK